MCLLIDRPLVDPFTTADQLVQHLVFGACAALLVLPAVFAGDGKGLPRRILPNPALAWVGLVSYGIFLWHGTLMINLDRAGVSGRIPGAPFVSLLLVTAVLSTIVAALSYYLVERPLLRLKYRRPDPAAPAPIRARA